MTIVVLAVGWLQVASHLGEEPVDDPGQPGSSETVAARARNVRQAGQAGGNNEVSAERAIAKGELPAVA